MLVLVGYRTSQTNQKQLKRSMGILPQFYGDIAVIFVFIDFMPKLSGRSAFPI
jgi:hypothetical protein